VKRRQAELAIELQETKKILHHELPEELVKKREAIRFEIMRLNGYAKPCKNPIRVTVSADQFSLTYT
jgi:hypothetical protein